jgi:hypothetical protein
MSRERKESTVDLSSAQSVIIRTCDNDDLLFHPRKVIPCYCISSFRSGWPRPLIKISAESIDSDLNIESEEKKRQNIFLIGECVKSKLIIITSKIKKCNVLLVKSALKIHSHSCY